MLTRTEFSTVSAVRRRWWRWFCSPPPPSRRSATRASWCWATASARVTAGGRARLNWALAGKPDLVVVELGANDALRGLPPQVTYANLDAIVSRLKARNIGVLLAGMLAPPNMGRAYETAFKAVYAKLAAKHDVAFYPFFLDGVAARVALNQADGIHPNARGVAVIVDRITPYVVRLLKPSG